MRNFRHLKIGSAGRPYLFPRTKELGLWRAAFYFKADVSPATKASVGQDPIIYLVILCRKGKAEEALQRLREIMGKLKLAQLSDRARHFQSRQNDDAAHCAIRMIQRTPRFAYSKR
jgi:hypothetical protein